EREARAVCSLFLLENRSTTFRLRQRACLLERGPWCLRQPRRRLVVRSAPAGTAKPDGRRKPGVAPQPTLRGQWAADDRTRRARAWRSRRSYQEARGGNSIASGPSSSNPQCSFVGMSRTADDIPTASIVDLSCLDISWLPYSDRGANLRTVA